MQLFSQKVNLKPFELTYNQPLTSKVVQKQKKKKVAELPSLKAPRTMTRFKNPPVNEDLTEPKNYFEKNDQTF